MPKLCSLTFPQTFTPTGEINNTNIPFQNTILKNTNLNSYIVCLSNVTKQYLQNG